MNVLAVQEDAARDADAPDQLVHAVEAAEQRGFAAAGRTDNRGNRLGLDADIHVLQGVKVAVVEVEAGFLS